MKKKILFICLDNICRSSTTGDVIPHLTREAGLEGQFVTDSVGVLVYHQGELPDSRMHAHATRREYELVHRPHPVRTEDFYDFNLIIDMDDRNIGDLREEAPSPAKWEGTHRIAEYCTRTPVDHAPGLYYGDAGGSEYVFDVLEDACTGLLIPLAQDS